MEVTIVTSLMVQVENPHQHIDLDTGGAPKRNRIIQTKYREINFKLLDHHRSRSPSHLSSHFCEPEEILLDNN